MPVATLEKPKETLEEVEESPETIKEIEEFLRGIPSDENIRNQIEEAGDKERVFPLDPDFIIALFFALAVDAIDIAFVILGLLDVYTLSELLSIGFDIAVLIPITAWMEFRTGKIAQSKRDQVKAIQKNIQQMARRMGTFQKAGKVPNEVFERYMRRYSKQMGRMGKTTARAARAPVGRTLLKSGIAFLGEILPIVGVIPFWTITVILTLREK